MLKILARFGVMETDAAQSAYRWGKFHNLSQRWIQTNKYIISNNSAPHQLISFVEKDNEITISLNDFNEAYIEKFVDGKMKLYSNGLIEKLKPVLTAYLKETERGDGEFTIIFKYRMMSLRKDVFIK